MSRVTISLNELTFTNKPFASLSAACISLAALTSLLKHTQPSGATQQSTLQSLLYRWLHMFHFSKLKGCWPSELRMLLLHHQTLTHLAKLLVPIKSDDQTDVIDPHRSAFSDILNRAKDLLEHSPIKSSKRFQHYLGLIAPIFVAGVQSMDSQTRAEAVSLLRSMQRTEGRWDSASAANIVESVGLLSCPKSHGDSVGPVRTLLIPELSTECVHDTERTAVYIFFRAREIVNPGELESGPWQPVDWIPEDVETVTRVCVVLV